MPILLIFCFIFAAEIVPYNQLNFYFMDLIEKRFGCTRFRFAELTRKKIDGVLTYVLFIDGDYYYHRSYSGIMAVLLEILTRDCLPRK